ncbi:MAG: acyltransferase, partial [Bradyrhizobium sp.]|nr:acyltransferase [Bradyrhizobium sp.]
MRRLYQLDVLRGIAAAIVVFHHILLTLSPDADPARSWPALAYVSIGRTQVLLFFVLSGYVLTRSLEHQTYRVYAIRRVFRLGIPFIASLLFALALRYAVHPHPLEDQSRWFNEQWQNTLTFKGFMAHILMRGHWADASLNSVLWSLWYEMRISLVLPLMVMFARWSPQLATAAFAALALIAAKMLEPHPLYSYDLMQTVWVTAYFVLPFATGMALALSRPQSLPGWLWPLAIVLLASPSDLQVCVGSAILIGLAIDQGEWLLSKPLLWLGKVSFSLYLFHMPIMMAMVYVMHDVLPDWLTMLIAVPTIMIFSQFAYVVVERPSI